MLQRAVAAGKEATDSDLTTLQDEFSILPFLFEDELAEFLCDFSLEDEQFWKDFVPNNHALRRAGLTKFSHGCKVDALARDNFDRFHAKLVTELRKVDVFYFLKIRELNAIFSRQIDESSCVSRLDQSDYPKSKRGDTFSPPATRGIGAKYQELARQERWEMEAATARGLSEKQAKHRLAAHWVEFVPQAVDVSQMFADSQTQIVRRFKKKSAGVTPLTASDCSHVKACSIAGTSAAKDGLTFDAASATNTQLLYVSQPDESSAFGMQPLDDVNSSSSSRRQPGDRSGSRRKNVIGNINKAISGKK